MPELILRAQAIKKILNGQKEGDISLRDLAESVISCCHDLINAGETQAATELSAASSSLAVDFDEELRIRLGVVRVRALNISGQLQESLELSESLLRSFADMAIRHPQDWAFLEALRATNLSQLNRVEEAIGSLIAIRGRLLGQPDSVAMAFCALQLAWAEIYSGNHRVARRYAHEAIVSARRSRHAYYEAAALSALAWIERVLCHWHSAGEAAEEALAICRTNRYRLQECHGLRNLSIISWKRGQLERAQFLIEEQIRIGAGYQKWFGRLMYGLIKMHEGSYTVALASISEVTPSVTRATSRPSLLTGEFLGDVNLEQGQATEALARYDEVFPQALALVPQGDIVAELRRRRAECYYLLGRHEDAYEEAKVGLEHCRELGDRYEEAATYRVLALSAAALGNASEARRWFDLGFAFFDDIETPYEWGKLWMAYGDWLRGPHAAEFADTRGALEAYHAARDHFERMGARAKLAEAEARISAITGVPPAGTAIPQIGSEGHDAERPAHSVLIPRRRPRGSAELERRSKWAFDTFSIITANKHLLNLLEEVAKLAKSRSPVLVLGESGTGKELVAHAVHHLSERAGNFMPINCSALPKEVIESELFGFAQGAFTGATRDKAGLLEVCDQGTAFLDEIGEMPLELQSRLLRVLETGELRRLGSTRNIRIDTRIVAATNHTREALERGEHFRPDLYYRLAHAVVMLPPLRRRSDDIELLALSFLDEACGEHGKRVTFTNKALEALRAHTWPGNVRELKSVVKRAVILAPAGHEVTVNELNLTAASAPATLLEELAQSERAQIAEALKQARGSRTEAAKALGIPRTTLINKIRRYKLS